MTTNSVDAAVESKKMAQAPEIQTVCGGAKTRDQCVGRMLRFMGVSFGWWIILGWQEF